jgi:microcystin degradation protein MlrC
VVCHGWSEAEVDAKAQALADMVNAREPLFAEELLAPDAAVTRAMTIAAGATRPVVIADTQDNPGCGGTCDTTGMLEALVRHDAQGVAMCVMCDADAAKAAHAAGEGATITLDLGGKHAIPGDRPFHGTFTVSRLSDGRFVTTGKSIPGRQIDLGPTALLSIGGIAIVVASKRMQAFDQDIYKHIGVEPSAQKILVLKSTCHFRADFQPIAEAILIAVAPGAHVVDSTTYPFQHLRPGVRLAPLGPEFRGTVL